MLLFVFFSQALWGWEGMKEGGKKGQEEGEREGRGEKKKKKEMPSLHLDGPTTSFSKRQCSAL